MGTYKAQRIACCCSDAIGICAGAQGQEGGLGPGGGGGEEGGEDTWAPIRPKELLVAALML